MLTLVKPKIEDITSFLISCREAGFTYDQIGATRYGQMPAGFDHDSSHVRLGQGRAVFDAAIDALSGWRMFPRELASVSPTETPIRAGEVIAITFKTPVVWCVSPCRIIYVIDERNDSADVHRFGFANGTLPGHVETGEERFLVEWNRRSDDVSYSIIAFSRPAHILVRIGYLYARLQQAKFRRFSAAAMQQAVNRSLRSVGEVCHLSI